MARKIRDKIAQEETVSAKLTIRILIIVVVPLRLALLDITIPDRLVVFRNHQETDLACCRIGGVNLRWDKIAYIGIVRVLAVFGNFGFGL